MHAGAGAADTEGHFAADLSLECRAMTVDVAVMSRRRESSPGVTWWVRAHAATAC
jgi:hypothetical protein